MASYQHLHFEVSVQNRDHPDCKEQVYVSLSLFSMYQRMPDYESAPPHHRSKHVPEK